MNCWNQSGITSHRLRSFLRKLCIILKCALVCLSMFTFFSGCLILMLLLHAFVFQAVRWSPWTRAQPRRPLSISVMRCCVLFLWEWWSSSHRQYSLCLRSPSGRRLLYRGWASATSTRCVCVFKDRYLFIYLFLFRTKPITQHSIVLELSRRLGWLFTNMNEQQINILKIFQNEDCTLGV